jgi:Trehalose-phosphatase
VARYIGDLAHASGEDLSRQLAGRRPAVFLAYDGTLTPIVDRPEDAIIPESMRDAIRGLAERCPAIIVSGRDRRVVRDLMGVDHLIVARQLRLRYPRRVRADRLGRLRAPYDAGGGTVSGHPRSLTTTFHNKERTSAGREERDRRI